MAVRRNTTNRLTLFRTCQTCGKEFSTTADTPWIRQLPNIDGKKQKTCYFCSEKCFAKSYKHIGFFDGKAKERKAERYAKRDIKAKNYKYYHAHEEQMRERRRNNYWQNHEEELLNNRYQKHKRKLLMEEQRSVSDS